MPSRIRIARYIGKREEDEVRRALGGRISTSHIERDNNTARRHNWRLTRKTLGYAKTVGALEWACAWTDIVYNFSHPHKALRVPSDKLERKWERRTPAMAAGTGKTVTIISLLYRMLRFGMFKRISKTTTDIYRREIKKSGS